MTEACRAQPPGPLVPGDGGSQGDYTAVTEPRISPIPQSEILNRRGGASRMQHFIQFNFSYHPSLSSNTSKSYAMSIRYNLVYTCKS